MFDRTSVTKSLGFKRCIHLPRNVKGRDFVVGDLHGHLSLFKQELDRLGFDPHCDRVLSVGDLIDRGPESLATLALIEEPWFHAVLGNHELMFLQRMRSRVEQADRTRPISSAGNDWVANAIAGERSLLARLVQRVATLPLAIHVDASVPFNVTHANLPRIEATSGAPAGVQSICAQEAEKLTSSRTRIGEAIKAAQLVLRFEHHIVRTSQTPLAELPMTYAGHSPVREVSVHGSYVYVDQGVCSRANKRAVDTPPTVLDHRRFAYWLGGVATAQRHEALGHAGRA
jgi:serine/threonine protein phosphatase 1